MIRDNVCDCRPEKKEKTRERKLRIPMTAMLTVGDKVIPVSVVVSFSAPSPEKKVEPKPESIRGQDSHGNHCEPAPGSTVDCGQC